MTEGQIIDLVAEAIPADRANRTALARTFVASAIVSVGRKNQVDFNLRTVTGTLTSGTKEYVIGKDIFSGTETVSCLANLHRTDTQRWPIEIVPPEEFYAKTGGATTTGAPTLATLEAGEGGILSLVLYPTPDSAYTVKATAKVPVVKIEDIPEHFHDVIVTEAVLLYGAMHDPNLASLVSKKNERSMTDDRNMAYSGKRVRIEFGLGSRGGRGASSRNLTGN